MPAAMGSDPGAPQVAAPIRLLPCPHCGAPAAPERNSGQWGIGCTQCCDWQITPEAWNRRVPAPEAGVLARFVASGEVADGLDEPEPKLSVGPLDAFAASALAAAREFFAKASAATPPSAELDQSPQSGATDHETRLRTAVQALTAALQEAAAAACGVAHLARQADMRPGCVADLVQPVDMADAALRVAMGRVKEAVP